MVFYRINQLSLLTFLFVVYLSPSSEAISSIFKKFPIFEWMTPENGNNNQNETVVDSPTGNFTFIQDVSSEICVPPLLAFGSAEPKKDIYGSQDVVRISCQEGYELENSQSSLLYCSHQGMWKVFTLGDTVFIPLPRCIVKRRCPPLPPLMQGSMQYQEGGSNSLTSGPSSTRAVYQCWFGFELEPSESEVRYCVQGKWTGENPQCVRAGCERPAPIAHGFFLSRGQVNHIYLSGSTVRYHCDPGYQLDGPAVLTCSGKMWDPQQPPTCKESPVFRPVNGGSSGLLGCGLPPPILHGEYQIFPWEQTPYSMIKKWNLTSSSSPPGPGLDRSPTNVIPVRSTAIYSCHRGYSLQGGAAVITCSVHGRWLPPYNTQRCLPVPPSAGGLDLVAGAPPSSRSRIYHRGRFHGGDGVDDDEDGGSGDDDDEESSTSGPLFISLTTACGVILVLSLIWIASRWTVRCRRIVVVQQDHPLRCQRRDHHRTRSNTLWDWMQQQQHPRRPQQEETEPESGNSDSVLSVMDREEGSVERSRSEDRVALIDSQATLPSYEEAVRASSTTTSPVCWPAAPPSYESILVENPPESIHHHHHGAHISVESDDISVVADAVGSPTDSLHSADLDSGSCETLLLVPSAGSEMTSHPRPPPLS